MLDVRALRAEYELARDEFVALHRRTLDHPRRDPQDSRLLSGASLAEFHELNQSKERARLAMRMALREWVAAT